MEKEEQDAKVRGENIAVSRCGFGTLWTAILPPRTSSSPPTLVCPVVQTILQLVSSGGYMG